jgi:hypothetical protein
MKMTMMMSRQTLMMIAVLTPIWVVLQTIANRLYFYANSNGARASGSRRIYHYTTPSTFCQVKIAKKTAQTFIPKLVQNAILIF